MSSRQRDEPSTSLTDEPVSSRFLTASTASASSSSASPSSATSTEVSTDANETDTSTATPPTKFVTKAQAATATVTQTTTATTTVPATGGRSSAASAGIGAGTGIGIAGLILLLGVAVVFFRRRRRKRRHPDPAPPAPVAETSSNAPPPEVSPEDLGGPSTGFAGVPNRNLLIGASDKDVRRQLSSLGLLIERHVGGNYHRDTILTTPDTLDASLRQLQLSEGTRRMVVRLSIDPSTRYAAIRHLLALVIFSNLDIHSVGLLSLLPSTVKELCQSRPRASGERPDSLVETALVSWNRITAFLMHENPQARTPLRPPPSVESQAKALLTLLQEFLVHFARIDDDHPMGEWQDRLAGVMRQCVKFGYEVFSHPCDWQFTFPQQEKGVVVVVPGLKQHSNNIGELYESPRISLPPEVVTVDLMEN